MRKRDLVSAWVKDAAKNIVRDEDSWRKYLNTASRIYKYPFWEQLCIYAQRPDAEACAPIEVWNNIMHCWVNKGAKGIALLDEKEFITGLKYVFDISDVHMSEKNGRLPYLWTMKEEHEGVVIRRLEKFYGETIKESGFIDRIREMAGRMAEDTCEQVVRDMEYLCHGSYLEEYDELNFRLRIRETLSESIAYTILRRCGVQEAELVDEISFPYIFEFNTVSTLSVLGDSISNQVKSVLMEIGKIIRAYDREHGKEYTAQKSENKVQNRLERTTANDYNTLKRESEAGIQKEEEKEKGAQDGTEIREKRRLPDSGTGDGRAAGRDAGKIRTDAGKLSEGTPERDLYGTSSGRETERTSVNGSGTGAGKDGIADRADEKAEGSGREPQSQRPDALGSGNERHQAVGRGNRAVGADIQLNREVPKPEDAASSGFSYDNSFKAPSQNNGGRKSGRRGKREAKQQKEEYVQLSLFPSVEEQVDEILYGRTETGNFSFQMLPVPDEVIDNILCTGSGMKGSRERIFAKFQERIGTSEIIKFLAEEYGTGGKGFHAGGQAISVWFDGEGIRFAYGVSARGESAVFLTWEMAEERIRSMIDRNIYGEKGEVWREDFITQDEIDAFLIRGGGVNSKLRIYEQFIENYFPNENIKFLKKEYGQGGFDNALPGVEKSYADYSAKGMWLTKGSLLEPEIELLLTWQTVEKYIRELVSTDRYLSQRETEKYIRYKREQWEADTAYEGNREPEKSPEQTEGDGGKAEPANFRITLKDSPKEERKHSAKETFWMNVEAIKLLKQIEGERRNAGPEEQKVLSEYAGWGGLQDAFNESKGEWREEYRELQNLLTEKEYAQARASILNAYYTPDAVIEAIYKVVGQTGFSKGRILEPSMGNGKFFGLLPEEMRESGLYGMEVDSLTGRIAKQLYPNASITIAGFEETSYPDNFFDLVVGNVPFGGYKVADKQYDKYHFLIHDYFLAKAIDKTKRGGIIAVVTTNGMGGGTFDKKDDRARRYFAQRCDLLGAIRLPERTFEHTEVATDILFFQKRERQRDLSADLPEWVETSVVYQGDYVKENGETVPIKLGMNNYFLQYPEMVLGRQEVASGPFGLQLKCLPKEGDFKEKLTAASARIHGHIKTVKLEEAEKERNEDFLPAEPEIKNYSYTLVENRLYYREDAFLKPVKAAETVEKRIRGMLSIRDCVQELLAVQLEDFPESAVREKQEELGKLYDKYVEEFGRINGRANRLAFGEDSGYYLLCSLEMLDEEGYFTGKADIFTKRTIKKRIVITSADTPGEALAISLNEKGKIDLGYMSSLTGQGEEEIINGLAGVIFKNPVTEKWETADEYLSGNVRKKLETARVFAENRPEYAINVSSLEKVQPKELEASEIEVTLGATWIEPEYVRDFMREIFQIPNYYFERELIDIQYIEAVGQWIIKGKNVDRNNALTKSTYGTERADGYRILEDTLNLKSTRVYDIVKTDGEEKRVLNRTETMLAGQKQETIREAFKEWIFMEPERRRALCEKYNRLFNAIRPREYDGSHLTFPAMSPEYRLEPYQMNAVAHQIYGHNTLLAHCVGAGKTFEMVAAAMESKRLGLCSKSLFVVPNHLIMQWAGDFLRLYPGANILAVTKKDFKPDNRKKFCSRIAMGDYDAIIIGHSMFEKIPISHERQADMIERQIREVQEAIGEMNAAKGEKQGIKQMEKTRKSLEARLKKLNDNTRKDDVITFEQLGVDRLFVDESHFYKNLFLHTKMRNVAGISQAEAQKSSDMFAKCQYMDELTGGKGITFATGTPISNSMSELYTNMRYLQYDTLQQMGWGHFDSWASTFGEMQEVRELAPEGMGYRSKMRFARFFNLPELLSVFKESADIQTADMLKLPVPEAEYENVALKPSMYQKEAIQSLAERADMVRKGEVSPAEDNLLKITNDGRKLALDQRIIDGSYPDAENSKVSACAEKAFRIWQETEGQRMTQLIFSDLSTPKGDGTFNVYEDMRNKLVEKGVPEAEIAFIHSADTDAKKAELFAKVRSGQVRFLMGSTQKMGAGTNVQDRLIALHHLDVPWRPSDIEQREGRIIRRNNINAKVKIFRYVTEETFDAYMWQILESKQKFISQVMTSKSPVRSCEDVDEASLSFAEVKALATGNPLIREKMDLDMQVARLRLLKANHTNQRYRLEDEIALKYPKKIMWLKEQAAAFEADIKTFNSKQSFSRENFVMKINGRNYANRKEAGMVLMMGIHGPQGAGTEENIGEYCGFRIGYAYNGDFGKRIFILKGQISHKVEAGDDALGNITRINNMLEGMEMQLKSIRSLLRDTKANFDAAKIAVAKPFAQEQELQEKQERLKELDAVLVMDEERENGAEEQKEIKESQGEGRISVKKKLAEMKAKVPEQAVSKALSVGRDREDVL